MSTFDETFDYGGQSSILQGQDRNRPWLHRHIDTQHLELTPVAAILKQRLWNDGDERTGGKQLHTKVHRIGHETWLRHVETPRVESLLHTFVAPGLGWRQNPRFIDKFSKIDLAAARPRAVLTCGNDQRIVKKNVYVEIDQVLVG